MSKKHRLFSEKEKLEKEYLQWCEKANKEIHGGRIDDKSFITVISFLQSIGWGNIKELESENAELRARLDKAVELPVKVGDEIFAIVGLTSGVEEYKVTSIEIREGIIWIRIENVDWGIQATVTLKSYGVRWFTELEKAESRLAELKGEKK